MMAVGAAVLLLGGTAAAQPGMMSGGMGDRAGMPGRGGMEEGGGMILQRILPMLHHLDLTEEQGEEIRDIVDGARDRIEDLRDSEMHEGMGEQFRDLFTSSSISVAEVEAILNRRLEFMEQVNSIVADAIVDIHGVLTEEQLQDIADFEPCGAEMHSGRPEGPASQMHGGSGAGIHPPR